MIRESTHESKTQEKLIWILTIRPQYPEIKHKLNQQCTEFLKRAHMTNDTLNITQDNHCTPHKLTWLRPPRETNPELHSTQTRLCPEHNKENSTRAQAKHLSEHLKTLTPPELEIVRAKPQRRQNAHKNSQTQTNSCQNAHSQNVPVVKFLPEVKIFPALNFYNGKFPS